MLEFYEIVTVVIYALLAFISFGLAWFDSKNAWLILPSLVMLGVGLAFNASVVAIIMPLGVAFMLLTLRKTAKGEPFDYQEHLLALLDSGNISQVQYEEESARIADYNR